MINVAENVSAAGNDLVSLASEMLDELATYATHLVGNPQAAIEHVAAGIHHAGTLPPATWHEAGRTALYRATTRACRRGLRFPPKTHGIKRFFQRSSPAFRVVMDSARAGRMTTTKRALNALPFEERAALLLRDYARLTYAEIAQSIECSPQSAARSIAAARRHFSTIYREISL